MRFVAVLYKGLEIDDGLVHQVVQDQRFQDDGGKSYNYRVLCGKYQEGMIHLYYVDKQVTCLVCLGTQVQPACSRTACRTNRPVEQLWVHKQTKYLYCPACALKINQANNERIIVPQSEL